MERRSSPSPPFVLRFLLNASSASSPTAPPGMRTRLGAADLRGRLCASPSSPCLPPRAWPCALCFLAAPLCGRAWDERGGAGQGGAGQRAVAAAHHGAWRLLQREALGDVAQMQGAHVEDVLGVLAVRGVCAQVAQVRAACPLLQLRGQREGRVRRGGGACPRGAPSDPPPPRGSPRAAAPQRRLRRAAARLWHWWLPCAARSARPRRPPRTAAGREPAVCPGMASPKAAGTAAHARGGRSCSQHAATTRSAARQPGRRERADRRNAACGARARTAQCGQRGARIPPSRWAGRTARSSPRAAGPTRAQPRPTAWAVR